MPFGGTQAQPTIKVGEIGPVTFDFTSAMTAAETISTQVVAASVYSGVDANPATLISGAATASGKVVSQTLAPSIEGNIYQLVCTITTSLGKTLKQSSYLAVVPPLI